MSQEKKMIKNQILVTYSIKGKYLFQRAKVNFKQVVKILYTTFIQNDFLRNKIMSYEV